VGDVSNPVGREQMLSCQKTTSVIIKLIPLGCILISLIFSSCVKKGEKWKIYSNIGDAYSIEVFSDFVWIGTSGGLVSWDDREKAYNKFTTLDGLGSHQNSFICKDAFGNLWIGSQHAITKYDGKTFMAYNSEEIFAESWQDYKGKERGRQIFFRVAGNAKDGNLWFMAGQGISTYNGQRWIHRDLSSFLPEERGYIYLDTKERIWALINGHGIYVIDSNKKTFYSKEDGLPDNDPRIFFEDRKGHIWISSTSKGLCRFDGFKWESYHPSTNLSDYRGYPLFEDKQGDIYFGTDKGFCRFDGTDWTSFEGVSDFWIYNFAEDEEGRLWAATDKGVCWWNGEKWIFLDYRSEEYLTDNWVITGAIDKEGKLWFGTGAGVTVYDGSEWHKYPLLKTRVNDILPLDNGEVWIAMQGGIGKFHDGEWKIYSTKFAQERGIVSDLKWELYVVEGGLEHPYAMSIAQDLKENIWVGTYGGLSRFDGEKWKHYTTEDGLPGNRVNSLAVDSEGAIWIGTEGGISVYDGTTWKNFTPKNCPLNGGASKLIFDRNGTLWFSCWGMGIGSFDGKDWKFTAVENGLPDNFIYSITPDNEGRIWVATENGGACVFKDNDWRYFSPKDGLPAFYVRKILVDKKGDIWFTSSGGISRLEGFEFHD
jgi:ligand-binding sensor domain-containing protein